MRADQRGWEGGGGGGAGVFELGTEQREPPTVNPGEWPNGLWRCYWAGIISLDLLLSESTEMSSPPCTLESPSKVVSHMWLSRL